MRCRLACLSSAAMIAILTVPACVVVREYPQPGQPETVRKPVFKVAVGTEGPCPVHVLYAWADGGGFAVRLENLGDRPWAVDLERSVKVSLRGTGEEVGGLRVVLPPFESRLIEVPFSAEDAHLLDDPTDPVVGRTCRLELALVEAGLTRAATVKIGARVTAIVEHPVERM